ncbi:hypothetical protein PRN20_09985 [Devosia sp. ZB163]|uniref:hypothetical protein n=1 Tax=Devosia sp. ZB163 TaxID=3025938 RepID=UPI00236041C2|nr:hypothetical protein [Devosia sp. ZB163]MDC9824066.1 hypothetical protein [Devosia sp. ZB163]
MTSDAPQPRLPITALIAASLFFNGTGYAATLPYTGIVAIEGLGFSNADYALVLMLAHRVFEPRLAAAG